MNKVIADGEHIFATVIGLLIMLALEAVLPNGIDGVLFTVGWCREDKHMTNMCIEHQRL